MIEKLTLGDGAEDKKPLAKDMKPHRGAEIIGPEELARKREAQKAEKRRRVPNNSAMQGGSSSMRRGHRKRKG